MSGTPELSVVIGVYNAGEGLGYTLDAMLAERDADMEVIVVDDGSTDATPAVLATYVRRDPRVRALHQAHLGLTHALVLGCEAARAPYIGRQDAGAWTRPLPGRFPKTLALLRDDSEAMFASCGTRFLGPGGEALHEVSVTPEEADKGLRTLTLAGVRGPSSHSAVVFRRDAFERVGGYRPCFRFAQDLDLWLRMVEQGRHVALPEILTERGLSPTGTSCAHRELQVQLGALGLEAARCRRAGESEAPALAKAEQLSRPAPGDATRRALAQGFYFIGSQLRGKDGGRARYYFRRAAAAWPFHARAWLRWATTRG